MKLSDESEIDRAPYLREYDRGVEADEIVFNAANPADVPTIGGEYINFCHPKTFDAPWLQSDYGSGVVEFTKGEHRVRMDFNVATEQNRRAQHRG